MADYPLMRRDVPLAKGRKLRVRVTLDYEVPLDDDLLPGEPAVTVADAEVLMGGVNGSSDRIFAYVERDYDRTVVEHEVMLADVGDPTDDRNAPRFEQEWMRRVRERDENDEAHVLLREILGPRYIDVPEPA